MKLFHRTFALVLSFLLVFASMGQAQAAFVSNNQLIDQVQQANDKEALLRTIKRADVQAQLLDMGVNSADIESRVDQMTQQEISQLNQQIDQLPAGGGAVGLVVLVFVIFVITDVIGATDIFPFIRPVR